MSNVIPIYDPSAQALEDLRGFVKRSGGRVGSQSATSLGHLVEQIADNHVPSVRPAVRTLSSKNRHRANAMKRRYLSWYEGEGEIIIFAKEPQA